jgi:septum formation inhibitor MinC
VALDRAELRGLGGGVQAVVPADVDDGRVAEVLGRTVGEASAFLGRAAVTVVLPGRALTLDLIKAVALAMAEAPDAVLAAVTTQPARPGGRSAVRTVRAPAPHAGHPIVHPSTLRAGQEIRHGGDVVVVGNVHRGARVIAEGNVIVLGRLEGVAHAGALGDSGCFIYAGRFAPGQVRIGDHIATGPQDPAAPAGDGAGRRRRQDGPEWARVEDEAIVVEPWPGGPPASVATSGGRPRRVRPA